MNSQTPSPIRRAAIALAALVLLGACSSQAEEREDRAAMSALTEASVSAAQDCLVVIWSGQEAPDRAFDRAHDEVTGGAISCATGTSPSQFENALAAIRTAAEGNDRAALVRELGIPLLYIDAEGNRREMVGDELIDAGFEEVFSPEMLALMAELELEDMTVVPKEGAFFELGSLWLVASDPGGRPRLVTVNRQALVEAAEAARHAAAAEPNRTSALAE